MSAAFVRAYIGLGSNLENPPQQLRRAILALQQMPHSQLIAVSPFYNSKPVGPTQPDYVNAVAALDTTLTAYDLLTTLQQIETNQGRLRHERWGARTLDLDILLYGETISNDPTLTLPHPYLTQRHFVLYPLFDLAPQLQLPDGRRLKDLVDTCPRAGLTRLNT